tara:strand:- start:81 stop:2237 length:2157 start_codon:yes stop_codon:yes gene_type:complete
MKYLRRHKKISKLVFVFFFFSPFFYCLGQCDNFYVINFSTGIWASEVSYQIVDTNNNKLYYFSGFEDNSLYEEVICLEDGCYELIMYDSYGDGWQGAELQMYGVSGEYILSGNLFTGFMESIPFALNQDCQIMGCTDSNADNFNPSATIDDKSCIFSNTNSSFDNVTLLGNWNNQSLVQNGFGGAYNEVFGFTMNGYEYAVIGSTMGTHIIDVTNPTELTETAFIPGQAQGAGITHRDFHVVDDYLYAVCDQGASTLQIINLSNLPDSVDLVYDSSELLIRSHNIFIDEQNYKLYSCSTQGLNLSGTCVFNIEDLENPEYLYSIPIDAHDIYVEDNIAYINGSGGVWIYDCSYDPQLIGSLTDYPYQGGNHSGWKQEETYIFADENFGYDVKICDITNINDIEVMSTFNSNVSNTSIPHNLIIKDNYVYLSYYHDGLQIFDISDPMNPQKVGYYDTYLQEDGAFFAGAWGVYPLLPSGNILVSDITSGLFVFNFSPETLIICDGDSVYLEGNNQFNEGVYVDIILEDGVENIIVTELIVLPNNNEYDCWGDCINDLDNDGVCDELEIPGCPDPIACNYNTEGTEPCVYAEDINGGISWVDCEGNCLNDIDNDGICDEVDEFIDCEPIPVEPCAIPLIWDPVCGCDGITYDNFYAAECFSIFYWTEGECEESTGLTDHRQVNKKVLKITDFLGREARPKKNTLLIYWHDTGGAQKIYIH